MQFLPNCPQCGDSYCIEGSTGSAHRPLLLSCGHTLCEACAHKLTSKKKLGCPKCKQKTHVDKKEGSVKALPQDIYISGLLALHRDTLFQREFKNSISYSRTKAVEKTKTDAVSAVSCFECHTVPADVQCSQCDVPMCESCFRKVHANSVALKLHKAVPLGLKLSAVPEDVATCSSHKNRTLEYYCQDDRVSICPLCVIVGDHKGHAVVPLENNNEVLLDTLKDSLPTTSIVIKKLEASLKALSMEAQKDKEHLVTISATIHQYFHFLHAKLQMREIQLIKEAVKLFEEDQAASDRLKDQLTEDLKNLESNFNSALEMLNNTREVHSNMVHVMTAVNRSETIPCYLPSPSSTATGTRDTPFSFQPDTDIVRHIEELGRVSHKGNNKPVVMSLVQYPDAITEQDQAISKDLFLSFHPPSPKVDEKEEEKVTLRRPNLLQRSTSGQVEQVMVAHLKNPSDFMVQRYSDLPKLKALMRNIQAWCSSTPNNNNNHQIFTVNRDDYVFAQYSQDNDWYRARVKKVNAVLHETNTLFNNLVEVLYIDYGNSEILPLTKLLIPPMKFFKDPEFALRCCIANITPVAQDDLWSAAAIKVFATIVNSKILTMTLLKEENNVWLCNLCTPPNTHIRDDIPTSLQDALIFLGYAKYKTSETSQLLKGAVDMCSRDYPTSEPLQVSDAFEVIISHVETPLYLYIQKMGTEYQYLAMSMDEMQTVYHADNKDLWVIYSPVKGMVCACLCPSDDLWYRARIIDVLGDQMVTVCYVDYGNTETVSYRNIRKLLDKFIMLPIQAKLCKLAYLKPLPLGHDTTQGIDWLTENFLLKECLLQVVALEASVCEVVLQHGQSGVVLNEAIVEQQHAQKCPTAPPSIPQVHLRRGDSPSIKGSPYSVSPEPCLHQPDDQSPPFQPLPSDQSPTTTTTTTTTTTSDPQVEVTISVFHSLAEFYIHTIENSVRLKGVMQSLQEFYEQSVPEPGISVKVGGDYAVYCPQQEGEEGEEGDSFCWFRGRVTDLLHSNLSQVFFLDFGRTEIVQISNMRMLAAKFMAYSSHAMKCHLAGYMPAGDKKEWSKTACEFAVDELRGNRYFAVKKDEIVEGSLPVDLLIEKVTAETALEPASRSYSSLGRRLLENGLAIPTRKTTRPPNPSGGGNCENPVKRPSPLHYQDYPSPTESPTYVVPSYVDDDGTIFAHECHKDELSPLDSLNKLLTAHYPNCELDSEEGVGWRIGDSCLCFYDAEKVWARAKVLAVQELIKVRYIDYGNQDMVSLNKLRTDIEPVLHLPPLCLRMALHGIVPVSGQWTSNILDFIHNSIVGKLCGIQLMNSTEADGVCEVRLIDPEGQELGEVLCQHKYTYHKYSLTFLEEQSSKIATMLESHNPYKTLCPTLNRPIPVLVTQVELPNVIYYQNSQRSPEDSESSLINSYLGQLEDLSVKLNKYATSAPLLKHPAIGKACCCQFTVDDCWYRCVVADIQQADMLVFYVDYGTSEYLSKARIRELPKKFLKLPSQAVRCVLKDLRPATPTSSPLPLWSEDAMKGVIDAVVNRELNAVLQNVNQPWPEVELFDTATSTLAYQSVIDSGLVLCKP
ncbi:finger 17 isoform X2 [Argonauta hians]